MRTSYLRPVGWGPLRLPGETTRIERHLERARRELEGPANRSAVERYPVPLGGTARLGVRKLYLEPVGEPMTGPDVVELQRRLRTLGYLSAVSGTFDQQTSEALVHFQRDFGIFTDGVCARVTVIALDYLEEQGVVRAAEAEQSIRDRIVWVANKQRSGMVVIAMHGVQGEFEAVAQGILNKLVIETQRKVESDSRMQSLPAPPELPRDDQIAFANSIKAEIVILLGLQSDERKSPGNRTVYFGKSGVDSLIGLPLASYTQEEIVRRTGAADLGIEAEDSAELMNFTAPTIRVEVGNLAIPSERRRLSAPAQIEGIASGAAAGVSRVYALGKTTSAADGSVLDVPASPTVL